MAARQNVYHTNGCHTKWLPYKTAVVRNDFHKTSVPNDIQMAGNSMRLPDPWLEKRSKIESI